MQLVRCSATLKTQSNGKETATFVNCELTIKEPHCNSFLVTFPSLAQELSIPNEVDTADIPSAVFLFMDKRGGVALNAGIATSP